MKNLRDRIRAGDVLVADGALGTMLLQRGASFGQCLEELTLSRPELLEQIAAAYLEAGAEIIQTNSFGGSPLKLARYGLDGKADEINRQAVAIVRRTVGDKAYVSGSCGPCGQMLVPYGDTQPEKVYQSFLRQIGVLINAGVDVICVETMTDPAEAVLAVKAARALSPSIPILATMTFDATSRGFFTIMGATVSQASSELELAGADVVGSNCGHGIDMMIAIAREFKKHTRLPLVIQSNAGLPELVDGVPVYRESPAYMAEKAKELIAIGVSVIGGCCGTTPAHIAAIRHVVDTVQKG